MRPERFELPTPWFVAKYSIQMSYGRFEEAGLYRKLRATNDLPSQRRIEPISPALKPHAYPGFSDYSMSDLLVACLCAEWCDTCRKYQPGFEILGHELSQHRFVWIDVEDQGDLVIDVEIENFPTLLVAQGGQLLFAGTMLPQIGHLRRLLETLNEKTVPQLGGVPPAELVAFRALAAELDKGGT